MINGKSNIHLVKHKSEGENAKKKDWSTLFPELLELILSLLIVKDCIRASAVCKAWYKSSVSIRMKDRHLWLMKYYPFSSRITRCEMYDPSQDVTHTMEIPEIAGKVHCYSKDGWLLMRKDGLSGLFLFNAFTRKLINLPNCEYDNDCVIFSCAPTSNSCLVFGLANIDENLVAVNTFRLGETEWETTHFQSPKPYFAWYNKIIFSGGLFYCLGRCGSLAVFNPCKRSWNVHNLKCDKGFTSSKSKSFGKYFVEIKGDLFFINTLGDEKLQVFRLNCDEDWIWEGKTRIDEGFAIFGGSCASEARSDITCNMRNKLFLAESLDCRHLVMQTYVFNEEKYLEDNSCVQSWDMFRNVSQSVWIEPPKQLLEFI